MKPCSICGRKFKPRFSASQATCLREPCRKVHAARADAAKHRRAGEMPLERQIGGDSRVLPGFVRHMPKPSEKRHLTGKTPTVMLEVNKICEPGGIILDLFAGSCSGGVAAQRAGYRWIGFEITEANHAEGLAWMLEEERGAVPPKEGQGRLW